VILEKFLDNFPDTIFLQHLQNSLTFPSFPGNNHIIIIIIIVSISISDERVVLACESWECGARHKPLWPVGRSLSRPELLCTPPRSTDVNKKTQLSPVVSIPQIWNENRVQVLPPPFSSSSASFLGSFPSLPPLHPLLFPFSFLHSHLLYADPSRRWGRG